MQRAIPIFPSSSTPTTRRTTRSLLESLSSTARWVLGWTIWPSPHVFRTCPNLTWPGHSRTLMPWLRWLLHISYSIQSNYYVNFAFLQVKITPSDPSLDKSWTNTTELIMNDRNPVFNQTLVIEVCITIYKQCINQLNLGPFYLWQCFFKYQIREGVK